ncbi:hypothetical protein ACOMHN_030328 [Nucella lapillus]
MLSQANAVTMSSAVWDREIQCLITAVGGCLPDISAVRGFFARSSWQDIAADSREEGHLVTLKAPSLSTLINGILGVLEKSSLLSPNWRKTFLSLLEENSTPHPGGGKTVVLPLHKSGEPELHPGFGHRGSRPAPPLLRSRISTCSVDRRVDSVPPRRLPHRLAFNPLVRPVRSP